MKLQNSSFYKEFQAQREEIMKHKWYESEKAGRDIGWAWALIDWTIKFKTEWLKERKNKKENTL